MTAPYPPHWTLNSCFDTFCTSWVHLGPFDCLTRLGAKWARLAQKFAPRNRVQIFRNERTRFTPLGSKLKFWRILYYLGVLGQFNRLTKLGAKWAELVQKVREWSRVEIFRKKRKGFTPLDPKLKFWRILYYLGIFGTIVCLMKVGAKWAKLVQKVRFHEVASKCFTTNAPDPPHCILIHVLACFEQFGCIWGRLVALQNSVQKVPN